MMLTAKSGRSGVPLDFTYSNFSAFRIPRAAGHRNVTNFQTYCGTMLVSCHLTNAFLKMKNNLFVALTLIASPFVSAAPPLSDFVGTYMAKDAVTLEIVAGDQLFAVINDAKYPMKHVEGDNFFNVSGRKIPFLRDGSGKVIGLVDGSTHYLLSSPNVAPESAALARARPLGQGSPESYVYRSPSDLNDGIAVGDISQSKLGVATANKIVRGILDGTWKHVHSVLLYHRGRLVLEEYFYGYNSSRPHQLRSATKTLVGAMAGLAVDRGALSGSGERVLPRLAYKEYANPDPRKAAITLNDLLTMRSGLACNDYDAKSPGNELVIDEAEDWVKATMDLPMLNDPGTVGYYCSGGVKVVGRMTENVTGKLLPDFAQEALFGQLGIARSDWRWNYTLSNANKEYSQIHMRPRDMLKFGMLYANGGRWNGKQLISEKWVQASLAEQGQIDGTGYGYFWWRSGLNVETPAGRQRVTYAAAQGNGGQKIYLLPQHDLVVVFTGGDYNSGGSPPNKIMATTILPALIAN